MMVPDITLPPLLDCAGKALLVCAPIDSTRTGKVVQESFRLEGTVFLLLLFRLWPVWSPVARWGGRRGRTQLRLRLLVIVKMTPSA